MARRFWVVLADDRVRFNEEPERGRLTLVNTDNFGVFYTKERAVEYARTLSTRNPGIEVQVAESAWGYHAPPPQKITQKIWNQDGEYVLP